MCVHLSVCPFNTTLNWLAHCEANRYLCLRKMSFVLSRELHVHAWTHFKTLLNNQLNAQYAIYFHFSVQKSMFIKRANYLHFYYVFSKIFHIEYLKNT